MQWNWESSRCSCSMRSTESLHPSGHDCVRCLPLRIGQLDAIARDGGRIALWGWGREGRAAYRAIRSRLPVLPLTLFCDAGEAAQAGALGDSHLAIDTEATGERLSAFAVVVKSPG